MCVVDGVYRYNVLILNKDNEDICEIGFKSVSLLCRFLDQFNFDNGDCVVTSIKDTQILDPILLLKIWRNE